MVHETISENEVYVVAAGSHASNRGVTEVAVGNRVRPFGPPPFGLPWLPLPPVMESMWRSGALRHGCAVTDFAAELPKLDACRRHLAAGILALAACFGYALRTTDPEVSFHFRQFASEEAQARAKRYRSQRDGLNQIMMVAE